MATIPGSLFIVSAGQTVNVQETTTGTGLPTAISGDFNLEVYVGALANAPPLAPGYQGLAVLTSAGSELDLVSGAYAVTDNGTGSDTISALGNFETVSGSGSAAITLNLGGYADIANAVGANDTIGVTGAYDTVYGGSGNDTIVAAGVSDVVNAGSSNNLITVTGDLDTLNGAGNDTIAVQGIGDVVNGSPSGTSQYTVAGNFDTISTGGGATDTATVTGSFDAVNISGADTINLVGGLFDTVTAGTQPGANAGVVNLSGAVTNFTFVDGGSNVYADTITGFSQVAGDRIHLTGGDTVLASSGPVGSNYQINLSDGSKIVLVGVTSINASFFS